MTDPNETKEEGFTEDLSSTWDAMEFGEPEAIEAVEPDGSYETADADESSSSIAAPEHWSQADREAFDALPDEAKPLYLEKVKTPRERLQ